MQGHVHYPYARHPDYQQAILLHDEEGGEPIWQGTLGAFLDENFAATHGDWPTPLDVEEIRRKLDAGEVYGTGGGAAAYFEISIAQATPAP